MELGKEVKSASIGTLVTALMSGVLKFFTGDGMDWTATFSTFTGIALFHLLYIAPLKADRDSQKKKLHDLISSLSPYVDGANMVQVSVLPAKSIILEYMREEGLLGENKKV